jgi:dTDP-glucose 4,6-dehydratase
MERVSIRGIGTTLRVSAKLLMHVPIETVKGQVINIGTGEDMAIKDVATLVLDMLGQPQSLKVFMGGRPGQVDRHLASTKKALDLLGWESKTDFVRVGLHKTIEWYRNNHEWWTKMEQMSRVPINRDGQVEYY